MIPPANHSPSAGDDRNLVSVDENYLAPSFEDRLRMFWDKNSRSIMVACAMVFAVIIGKGAYEFISSQREKSITADYAAATTDSQLKAFAASHDTHILGGVAQLLLADKAYAAGNYAEARSTYNKAAEILKKDILGQRARLGAAISAVQAGATAEGEAALKLISADLGASKSVRAEATYNLAALSAGNSAEAIRYIEQVMSIAPEGQWAERASLLRVTLPAAATASVEAKPETIPTVSFK